jgi:hypothetical protein
MNEPGLVLAGAFLALAVLVAEAIGLWRLAARGAPNALPRLTILLITGAGAGLIAALILAMLGAEARWIGLCLALAGIAHGLDLLRRLRGSDR